MHKVFKASFADIYQCYVVKVEKKGRSVKELNEVIAWLTGYESKQILKENKLKTMSEFFEGAKLNPNAKLITGSICGVKIEEISDPLMKKIRYLDKVVDELAKGKAIEKIKR